MLNSEARSWALSNTHWMCSGLSPSKLISEWEHRGGCYRSQAQLMDKNGVPVYLRMAFLWATVRFLHIQRSAPVAWALTRWCTMENWPVGYKVTAIWHSCLKAQWIWTNGGNINIRMRADLWRIQLQCAFDTSRHARQDDPGVSFKAFSPSINEGDDGGGVHNFIFIIQQGYLKMTSPLQPTTDDLHTLVRGQGAEKLSVVSNQHPVHPASGNDGVQSADDDVEL